MTTTIPRIDAVEAPSGLAVLDEVRAILVRYVVLPCPEAYDAVALWIAATHGQLAWEHATRLAIKSPLRRCGKTRLLEVIGETAHDVIRTTNISTAALVRSLDEDDPRTLLLDEADAIFAKHRGEATEKAEDLRGILNSGHSRGWPYIRWNAQSRAAEHCPTFAMAALAAIGDLPDTIEDRGVVILMRRRGADEYVAPWRTKRVAPTLKRLRDDLSTWVRGNIDELREAEPTLPVEDRAADTWEPLVAIADLAGGDWPARSRRACLVLTSGEDDSNDSAERLLEDMRAVLDGHEWLVTSLVLEALKDIEDAPWADWANGRGLSPRGLAQLLKPFGVRPAKWSGGQRGYRKADFEDAWTRYRRTLAQPATSATPDSTAGVADTEGSSATAPATPEPDSIVAGWAGVAGERLNGASVNGPSPNGARDEVVRPW